ncbi:hypothetical protein SARC_15517 [Sphaeroforma arctica JP610]|uniref:Uncharacterized protein n=1 Tax=Sphaeroforma arctica JP610 TaxID=667725 RepID=A0A0L0F5E3_9EUKA|nr:hypothetical protein SARC_15517 [Sphaeroforma arctica JP610]KNC71937.1 hypothetical protein SARC_15517 [Sphaeroforma arctica JP610]|eukprot:XP_014145839.1 hypothetical protein SARC_15517 [Sphaeroforma arctica JP610]
MSSTAPNSTPSPATDPEGHGTQHAEGQRRGHKRTKSAINAGDLVPNFVESKERTVLMQAIDGVHAGLDSDLQKIADSDDTTGDSKELSTRFAQSVFQQTSVLIRRDFTNLLRSPATRFSYGIIVVQFLFYGLLFLGKWIITSGFD